MVDKSFINVFSITGEDSHLLATTSVAQNNLNYRVMINNSVILRSLNTFQDLISKCFSYSLVKYFNALIKYSHRNLLLKYLFGASTFLGITYLFVDIHKIFPGKSIFVRQLGKSVFFWKLKRCSWRIGIYSVNTLNGLLENFYLFCSWKNPEKVAPVRKKQIFSKIFSVAVCSIA